MKPHATHAVPILLVFLVPIVAVFSAAFSASEAVATETRQWVVDKGEEFLKGQGDGVAVTHDGRLIPVPPWDVAASFTEPVVIAGALTDDGSAIVGTGHPARLYRVGKNGPELLSEIPGHQVTAVHVTSDGSILVAAVPPAVLFRWSDGELEELGRLGAGGIWDLASIDNTVFVATGPPASLYRVGQHGLERWLELPDTHVRCLAATPEALLVGTSGQGLIFKVLLSGEVAMLSATPFTEISDLVAAGDGSIWATAVVGEPAKPTSQSKRNQGNGSEGGNQTATAGTIDLELPKVNGTSATSELLRLTPDGGLLKVHRFTKQVATALAADGDGVYVGTGFEGEVWRFTSAGGARLRTVDAVQVVVVLDGGRALLTQGPAQLLRRGDPASHQARFRIDTKHFDRPVRFGEFRVDPPSPQVQVRFRSGVAKKPDKTWLPWTEWLPGSGSVVPLPPGHSLQWELELPAGQCAVERIEVAYREVNLPPRIKSMEVLDPGVVYLPGSPPPGSVIEITHPDHNGIFSTLDEQNGSAGKKPKHGKKYYRVGYRSLVWEGVDSNQDPLRYRLRLERRDGFCLDVRENLKTTRLALDTTAVPDGIYRFQIMVSDQLHNPGQALEATAFSHWFTIDNSPPALAATRQKDHWLVTATEAHGAISRAEWSRDGERWQNLVPSDGLVDGRQEQFRLAAVAGRHLVVVRVIDRHHNRAVLGLTEE